MHEAIQRGLVRSCHDLSEGGLAVAVAEMAFAGGVGADLTELGLPSIPLETLLLAEFNSLPIEVLLFSESTTRFLLEVKPEQIEALAECFGDVPLMRLGQTCKEPRLRIAGPDGEWIIWSPLNELKEALAEAAALVSIGNSLRLSAEPLGGSGNFPSLLTSPVSNGEPGGVSPRRKQSVTEGFLWRLTPLVRQDANLDRA